MRESVPFGCQSFFLFMAIALKHKSTKASESDGKKTNGRYWAYQITYTEEIIITDTDKVKFNFILDSVP